MISAMAGPLEARVRADVSVGEFGSWMASEQKRIFLLCRRMLQDVDEADSATQDVFLNAYRALTKNRAEAVELDHPDKWVTRIAVNICLDRLRSKAWKIWRRRPSARDEEAVLGMEPGKDPDAERQMFSKEIQQRLELALQKLSDRQRAVFTLRHYDGMVLDEIGELLRLDTGTVKAHLFRATAKLRDELIDLYAPCRTQSNTIRARTEE